MKPQRNFMLPTNRGRRIVLSRKAVEEMAIWMSSVSQTLSRVTPGNAVHTCAGIRYAMGVYESWLRDAAKPTAAKRRGKKKEPKRG